MTEFSEYAPGTFCWVDLGTTDASAAKRFYSGLFGWDFNDVPAGLGMVYTMCNVGGKDVAALYQQGEEQRAQGIPPHWMSYVSVASADDSAGKARSLGGTVVMEPFDVFDAGRMALAQDPTGATFAVWQPRGHIGARIANEPGTLCWNELMTRDVSKARDFYTALFGWGTRLLEMGPSPYTLFLNGSRAAGGMMETPGEWGDVPPHWMVYFAVEDCDRSVKRAKELGGNVMVPPTDIPDIGRFAVLQDLQGVAFSIIRLLNPD